MTMGRTMTSRDSQEVRHLAAARQAREEGQVARSQDLTAAFSMLVALLALRYFGAAMGWPFVPATVNIGSDLQWRSSFKPDEYPCTSKIPEIKD